MFRLKGDFTGMDPQDETLRRALEALDSIRTGPILRASRHPTMHPERQHNGLVEAIHDPASWREQFVVWLDLACVRHRRCSSNVTSLHKAYCDWEISSGDVPCSPVTFERLLGEIGFMIEAAMVSTLILKEDLNGLQTYPEIGRLLR